jgi:hypothetical protein
MAWTEVGEYLITQKETDLVVDFESMLAIKPVDFTLLKPSWDWAGYFIQFIDVPVIGQVRIEEKINLSTRQSTLIVPKFFESNYQLKFYKANWIPQFKLLIYENDMPTFHAQDNLIFPNNKATSSTANAIPPATTSTQLLAANANRKSALFGNATDKQMILEKGATASVTAAVIKLAPMTAGGLISYHDFDDYTGVVTAIAPSAAVGAWNVREFV